MSTKMEDEIKRWTAKRKSALVLDIIQGKTTVAEASRFYDLSPVEIENWVDDARRGMENAWRANPLSSTNARSKVSRRPMVKPCWSYTPEKSCNPCWARTRNNRYRPAGNERRRF